ncbi:MAG: CPBP family intramembrane metalloprotease [Acholeplasmataceae bacterium]|nr:MAG: CPBP family intramembrane metalloprotease [Acholeplasmataceae bacterium]
MWVIQMKKENNLIEFEDIFKDEIKARKEQKDPFDKRNYGTAIIMYVVVMFLVAVFLFGLLSRFEPFLITYDEHDLILEQLIIEDRGFAVMDGDIYDQKRAEYGRFLSTIDLDHDHVLIYHRSNVFIEETLYSYDEIEEETFLDPLLVEALFTGGIDTWGDSGAPVLYIYGETIVLPFDITIEGESVLGPVTSLSRLGLSVLNFLVYVILLPILIRFLKRDLVEDWSGFKLQKNQWFSIIIVGYLYLLAGNLIANLLSSMLGTLLQVESSVSVNQMTIIRTLHSNGAVFMIVSAVILGPIVEEMIFRKAIFGLITNERIALTVSTLSFGFIHLIAEASFMQALVNGISYFVMGLVFGFIYIRNGKNIWPVIIIHIITNLVAVLGILYIY